MLAESSAPPVQGRPVKQPARENRQLTPDPNDAAIAGVLKSALSLFSQHQIAVPKFSAEKSTLRKFGALQCQFPQHASVQREPLQLMAAVDPAAIRVLLLALGCAVCFAIDFLRVDACPDLLHEVRERKAVTVNPL